MAPQEWWGDKTCDNGVRLHNNRYVDFNCRARLNDKGACKNVKLTEYQCSALVKGLDKCDHSSKGAFPDNPTCAHIKCS